MREEIGSGVIAKKLKLLQMFMELRYCVHLPGILRTNTNEGERHSRNLF